MVERANVDRVFLVYDKKLNHRATRSDVSKFAAHFKQELKNIFTSDSLTDILADTSSMSYYNKNPIINARLSEIANQYSNVLCSNPQEEELMEEESISPKKSHRNYYITELSAPTAETSKTYSQATSSTSLSSSQISTLTNTVASKNREEMTQFQENRQIHHQV